MASEEDAAPEDKYGDEKTRGRKIDAVTPIAPSPKKAKQEEAETVQRAEASSMVIQHQKQPGTASAASASVGEGSGSSAPASRPRFRPYPRTGKVKDLRQWQEECAEVRKFYANYPGRNLPSRREPKDPETTDAVQNPKVKEMILSAAHSIISVSSIMHDGKRLPPCTDIIIKQSDSSVHDAIVVTCSRVVSEAGKKLHLSPKLTVGLADKETVLDAELIHYNHHYDIALLRFSPCFPLEIPSFGQGPEYGQEVFVLARDEEVSLRVRCGEIQWLEESDILRRDYYMFLSCEIPEGGSGGMVIDHNGKVRGMSFHYGPDAVVLSISTIVTCFEMFMQFSRIARPILGFALRTVALLDIELQEEIANFGIKNGFIVGMVYGSDADNHGIERGNVITSINGQHAFTLPQLEDFLLSFGREYLQDSSISTEHFKLAVCDLKSRKTTSTCLQGSVMPPSNFEPLRQDGVLYTQMSLEKLWMYLPSSNGGKLLENDLWKDHCSVFYCTLNYCTNVRMKVWN